MKTEIFCLNPFLFCNLSNKSILTPIYSTATEDCMGTSGYFGQRSRVLTAVKM
jgi:hypothetical protein